MDTSTNLPKQLVLAHQSEYLNCIRDYFKVEVNDLLLIEDSCFRTEINELKAWIWAYIKDTDWNLYWVLWEVNMDWDNIIVETLQCSLLS